MIMKVKQHGPCGFVLLTIAIGIGCEGQPQKLDPSAADAGKSISGGVLPAREVNSDKHKSLPQEKTSRPQRGSAPDNSVPEPVELRFRENRFFRQPDLFLAADDPRTVDADNADFLRPTDEVLGLLVSGHARAYPVRMLCYHHVVNDRIADRPITVTYCVICSSGIAYDPQIEGQRQFFGFHGIWQGTAVLYDQETRSNWLHLSGECIEGPRKGARLQPIPGVHATWAEWKRMHPETDVMAPDVKFEPKYFPRESAERGLSYFPDGFLKTIQKRDKRLGLTDLCLGVRVANESMAFPFAELNKLPGGIQQDELAGTGILVVHEGATRTTSAFVREHPEGRLELELTENPLELYELRTQSHFSRTGLGIRGPLAGWQMPLAECLQAEWYGWFALHPDTKLFVYGENPR